MQKQTALIKELATKSDCVIVGRNADIILREQDPLRLFVHADMEARIARCRRREVSGEDFTDKEYEKKIRQVDKNRAKTHGILATYDWGDRRGYDLCINTTHVTVRDIIPALAGLRQNLGRPPTHKRQNPDFAKPARSGFFLCAIALLSYMITSRKVKAPQVWLACGAFGKGIMKMRNG